MTVRAPGKDSPSGGNGYYSPSSGAGGVFAEAIQGATPKYALNRGFRADTQHRDTMARLFIRVDADEYNTFLASIGDSQVRNRLADRIAGDPTSPRRRGESISDTGYVDFLITNVQMGFQEKVQVSETLADNYVAYFFGQTAPMWTYTGYLINSVQDDQATNFLRLYLAVLRGTQLARRQKIASLRYDSYIVAGAMTNLNLSSSSQNELLVQFSFQFLVKKLFISNYTAGWVPTRPGGEFAADPLLVAYDGRPRGEINLREIVARTPPGTDAGPTADTPVNQRASFQPPADAGATPPAVVSTSPTTPAPLSASVVSDRPETVAALPGPRIENLDPNVRPRGATP